MAPNLWRTSMPQRPADAGKLRKAGVEVVVSLDDGAPVGMLETAGLQVHPIFTPDMTPPSFATLDAALDVVRHESASRAVAVHCIAGWGRTGSVLASHLALALAHDAPHLAPEECAWQGLRAFWRLVPPAESHMKQFGQAENVVRYVAARAR